SLRRLLFHLPCGRPCHRRHGCQDLLDLPHTATQRPGRHLEIGVIRHAAVLLGEELGHAAQLRQLAAQAAQVLLDVLPLVARLHGADGVEDHPVDFEHLLIVLHFVGVFEELTHHPGVRQNDVEALDRFFGGHCGPSWMPVAGAAATAGAGGFRTALFLPASASSLENSTRAAPRPTRIIPTHSFQPGKWTSKWNGSPGFGCQKELTSTLITGARPKMSGAM